jgi:uncharacterized membrane protein
MFEWLFKYPATAFAKGHFVFLTSWPVSLLVFTVLLAGGLLFWQMRRSHGFLTGLRPTAIWLLQTAFIGLILLLLWHPALSVATLRPQQNVVTVLFDHSRSMGLTDQGNTTRLAQAQKLWQNSLAGPLTSRFQVRAYEFGKQLERVADPAKLQPDSPATHIGDTLDQVANEASNLPVGAVVLLTDGSDNAGGVSADTIARIRQARVPVYTVGFGRETPLNDIEISEASLPMRSLAQSRLSAQVTFRQYGFAGRKTHVTVRDAGKIVSSEEVTLAADGVSQTETVVFNAGAAGPRAVQITVDPVAGEENTSNNTLTRLVNVSARKQRILYIEGEPRWEYKFLRRAVEDDGSLEIDSMLRTTPNKMLFQFVKGATEQTGFPSKAEDLFAYDGLIIGSVEANYFTPVQQDLIRQFADRRGGGVLFLAGRFAFNEGGYARSPIAEVLPVHLTSGNQTFHRDYVSADLARAGRDSAICRLEEGRDRNAERWKKMPQMANYQVLGEAKPGAVTLMETLAPGNHRVPLLVTENFGRGRTAVLASAGTWRWQMSQPVADMTHEIFWRQLLRWLVTETPGAVLASTPRQVLSDETKVKLRVEVRDKTFQPVANARVDAHIVGPDNLSDMVTLLPVPAEEGVYAAEYTAEKPGSYLAEISGGAAGSDVVMFRREDGTAETFRTTQNKELLQKLAEQSGGKYFTAADAKRIPEQINFSDAGITTSQTLDLWDMPIVFLLALGLRATEWLLRRKWSVV